jgi:hypothetical protein
MSQQSDEAPLTGSTTPRPPSDAIAAARFQALDTYLDCYATDLPYTLRPVAALREVVAVCDSIAGGRSAPHAGDRRSLQADVQAALTWIGGELADELQPGLSDFLGGELRSLTELLADTGGSARLGAAAAALMDRLLRPAALEAAWRDLLTAVDHGTEVDRTGHLALVLRELDEGLGHEWLLRKSRFRDLALENQPTGTGDFFGGASAKPAKVAWFVFADADLVDDYLRIGQIQFFSHRVWPDAIATEAYFEKVDEGEVAGELDANAVRLFRIEDSSETYVYARVELSGPRAEPSRTPEAHGRSSEDWARELVSAVVDAGTFPTGGSAWRLLAGAAVYHGRITDASGTSGNWSGSYPFIDPTAHERVRRRFVYPPRGTPEEALAALDPRFAELAAEEDPGAIHAVEEVRWYEAARRQPDPAQRLVLHVRAFERALPISPTFRWTEAVSHYLGEFWAIDEFANEVFGLAYSDHQALTYQEGSPIESLEKWLTVGQGSFSVALGTFMREAAQIHPKLLRQDRVARRRTKEVARWQDDQGEALRRIQKWEQRFTYLLARAVRQRNATVHGVRTVPEVVASVDPFIARVASFVVTHTIASASTGSSFVELLSRERAQSRRVLWRLGQGDAASDEILFGAESGWRCRTSGSLRGTSPYVQVGMTFTGHRVRPR